jgi:hypothetical protein
MSLGMEITMKKSIKKWKALRNFFVFQIRVSTKKYPIGMWFNNSPKRIWKNIFSPMGIQMIQDVSRKSVGLVNSCDTTPRPQARDLNGVTWWQRD